ncbi:MAG: hydrogenase maturation protease [Magnetococcus sp. DMHC-1]|nr:hydrogenase maturation protease [Magnetococcales bacterium]
MAPWGTTDFIVVGIGSRYGRDDAIGLALVEALPTISDQHRVTSLLWEDADALTLAHDLLELSGPVLIVDCADMGLESGAWRFFSWAAEEDQPHRSSISTHGLGMAEAIALARGLGFVHAVHVFGIQPFDLSPVPGLTPEMRERFPHVLAALVATVDRLGNACQTGGRGQRGGRKREEGIRWR